MSDSFKVQASIKDRDGDMVNLRADSNEELAALIAGFPYDSYAQAKAQLNGVAAAAPIVAPVQPSIQQHGAAAINAQPPQQQFGSPPAQQPAWSQPAPQQAPQAFGPQNGAPHPEGKACGCGQTLVYKAFTSKQGKHLKMWTCPQQQKQGDGHASEFIWDN